VIQDGGSLTKIGTGTLTLSGANIYTGLTTINAGELVVNGSIMSAVTVNNGGTLGGSGTAGSVTVKSGGILAPGGSQTLHINGNYAQNPGGVLMIEVAGPNPASASHVDVTGDVTIDGTLEVRFVNGFLPTSGQVIEILHVGGALAGSFAQIIFPDLRAGFQFQTQFANGTYQITALNDGVAATGFLNISTRMRVGTGDNALIGGFIITGNVSKKVIIRGIGPSLAPEGTPLPGRLADPTLELRNNAGSLIFSNDNWMESPQAQEIIDSTIPPSDEHEAAIVATLMPGNYTAIMRGVNNSTGIGVVEVYDLAQAASARLANISSRGFVDIGDNVMIAGFIAGNQATPVIVRALGPSLTQSGIANALADPTLELHNSNGAIIAFNNDWQETDPVAIEATGIPPGNKKESAIVAVLAPGNYTAIVRGQNDTTGVGLVEVYDLH
jgi:autotransporter-associated beta strand protein